MALRRGFKSEAHALADEIRAELKLNPFDRLNPWILAAHLEIPILSLSEFRQDAPWATHYLSQIEPECFSAVTVFRGRIRTIVHNDSHASSRQASNLAHELAHGILLHPPTPAFNDTGCRLWNQNIEDEANFLGAALLITQQAAIDIALHETPIKKAAQRYGVSTQLLRYRLNMTGAYIRSQRIRNR